MKENSSSTPVGNKILFKLFEGSPDGFR
ncbi:uncharacterized protein METZ01_LOCUS307453, partial [marine metagenome]